jgi:Integrase core domain
MTLAEREQPLRFLVRDRDSKFTRNFDEVFRTESIRVIKTPVRALQAKAHTERWVGNLRRECLDRLVIVGRRHLEQVVLAYISHDSEHRPHRSLKQRPPLTKPPPDEAPLGPARGVRANPTLGARTAGLGPCQIRRDLVFARARETQYRRAPERVFAALQLSRPALTARADRSRTEFSAPTRSSYKDHVRASFRAKWRRAVAAARGRQGHPGLGDSAAREAANEDLAVRDRLAGGREPRRRAARGRHDLSSFGPSRWRFATGLGLNMRPMAALANQRRIAWSGSSRSLPAR